MDNSATYINNDPDKHIPAAVSNPAADDRIIAIPKAEYDSYIALSARIDTIKDYIANDKYANIDTVCIMLGIEKTS